MELQENFLSPMMSAVDSNDRIFIVEGSSGSHTQVSPYSQRGENSKLASSIKTLSVHNPYGVAIHRDNLYVTDGTLCIHTEFPLIAKQGSKGHQIEDS